MRVVRVILYTLILALLFFVPLHRIEIANLKPVEAVWMTMQDCNIVLLTDTGVGGRGITVEKALTDMKENSLGIVYLDTARYLFVSDSAVEEISAIASIVNGTIELCKWEGHGGIKAAVKYADSHNMGVKLSKWNGLGKMPELPPLKQEK